MNREAPPAPARLFRRMAAVAMTALLASTLACVSQRRVLDWPLLPPSGAYGAVLSGSLSAWGRGVPLSGSCAVDGTRGVRVELRDPMGATRLLLLATPEHCTLVNPGVGLYAQWDHADASAPWDPADLWLLFTGRLPASVSRVRMGTEPTDFAAWWRNGLGRVEGRFESSGGQPCPFRSAALEGPGKARLSLTFSAVRSGAFGADAFSPPPGDLRPSTPRALLEALGP